MGIQTNNAAPKQSQLWLPWYKDYEWEERQKARDRFRNWTAKFEQTLQPDYEPPLWHEPLSNIDNQAILTMAQQIDDILAEPSPNPETIQQLHRQLKWHQDKLGGLASLWREWCNYFIRWNWLVNRCSQFVGPDYSGSIVLPTWGDRNDSKRQCKTICKTAKGEYERKHYTSCIFGYAKVKLKLESWETRDGEMGDGCDGGVQVTWQMPGCMALPSQTEMGETIPAEFLPAILDGIEDVLLRCAREGNSIVRCKITILGGRYHPADSRELDDKIAAYGSLRNALDQAQLKTIA